MEKYTDYGIILLVKNLKVKIYIWAQTIFHHVVDITRGLDIVFNFNEVYNSKVPRQLCLRRNSSSPKVSADFIVR